MKSKTRIKLEDYYGNDIVEIKLNRHIYFKDIEETDEYNIADVDIDEQGEYIRLQLIPNSDEIMSETFGKTDEDYKTCDKCCYDKIDENGEILEHYCIDDKLYIPNNNRSNEK